MVSRSIIRRPLTHAGSHPTQSHFRSRPSGRGEACARPLQAGSTGRSTPLEDVSMKQSCVSAFARAARFFALAAVALGLGAGSLLAQGSTGKIEGRVRDQAGAPIANAQVFIVGTAFNALTNPAGLLLHQQRAGRDDLRVRAAFIGYKSTQVDGVKVLAGQTDTVDIQLEQTAVQIQEITVVTQQLSRWCRATRSPRSSASTVSYRRAAGRPAEQRAALQPGVVAAATPTRSPFAAAASTRTPPMSTASRCRRAIAAPARARSRTLRSRTPKSRQRRRVRAGLR